MSRKAIALQRIVWIIAAILCFSSLGLADITGTIMGVVTDPTGAAVPGASITLRNPSTGYSRHAVTDTTGSYEFLLVPVGSDYVVEAEKEGFRKATQTGITLLVNQKFRADFALVVGALAQTVEVTAASAQVETTSTQVGDVIEDTKMSNLPLNGRSYIDLLGLQAGVVPMNSGVQSTDRPVSGNGNAGNLSVNGQREANNSFLVNGGDVEEGRNNGASIVPVLDSIQEFRLLTNSFDAEYGRFSGAIVNVVTKAGTNGLHGTLFEFLRNERLDSRNFFELNQSNPVTGAEEPGTARGEFRRNQFGWAIGGPILKNKLFFFSDYQGSREIRGLSTGNISVPSLQERTGDFSDTSTTGFKPLTGVVQGDNLPGHFAQTLTQRLGYPVTAGEPYWFSGCTSNTQCVFPGEVIPQAAWDPVAAATEKFIPTPVGALAGAPFFSTSAQKEVTNDDKFGIRVDLSNPRTGNWLFYYHRDNASLLNPYPSAANVPGFPALTPSLAQQFNLSNTETISPATVNEFVFNYTRLSATYRVPKGGLGDITSFGFTKGGLGINPVYPPLEGMPYLNLSQLGVTIGIPDGTTGQYNNTFQVTDHLSKVMGRHTAKFGGEYRYLQINERNTYAQNGYFGFNGAETGNDFADYLIGAVPPGDMIQSSRQFLDSRTKYFGLFAQDTFKARPNFTLNYGLRWEASEPYYDTQGKIEAFVPGLQSKLFPTAPMGWVVPGDSGIPSTLSPTRWNNFGPRVGFAYSPGFTAGPLGKLFGGPGKTSIRAAYGLYYTAIEDLTLFVEVGDSPYGLFFVGPSPVYLNEPYKTRTAGADVGQRFPFVFPPVGVPDPNFNWAQVQPLSSAPGFKVDNVLPYAEHYNFSLQREISSSLILTLGYVGTQGHHLIAQASFNPGIAATCLQTPGCGPWGEDTIYTLPNGTNVYGTRPYSVTSGRYLSQGILDFSENTYEETLANSNYNSLQVSLEKRVGALRLLGAYTWSKSLDNSSAFSDMINPFNASVSKSLSTFDLTHNFVVSYSYDLPFARLGHLKSGPLHKLLSGWTVTGITRLTTGLPVYLGEGDDASLCSCGVDVPNWTGQAVHFANIRSSPTHTWFVENYTTDSAGNTVPSNPFFSEAGHDPILHPVFGVLGNANRRFFHGPGLNNWDLSLHKDTRITERMSLEYRAEFFNVFNHAQFGGPSGSITSSTFGLVTGANDPRIGQMALKFYF
jgi:hypothetical protein